MPPFQTLVVVLSAGLLIGLLCGNHVLHIQGVLLVVAGEMAVDVLASLLNQFFIKNCTGTKPGEF
jgi:hypothetical protein